MAFIKASAMMEESQRNSEDGALRAQALRFNQLFWNILQADILDSENKLPNEIKANIMSLSIFVDKQTSIAMRSTSPGDLDILISINRNLASGLRTTQAEETPPPPAESPGVTSA